MRAVLVIQLLALFVGIAFAYVFNYLLSHKN
jgi:hypothetical protein